MKNLEINIIRNYLQFLQFNKFMKRYKEEHRKSNLAVSALRRISIIGEIKRVKSADA